eukprot:s2504_g4.t1
MRQPAKAIERLPMSKELGSCLRELLENALVKYPALEKTAQDILDGQAVVQEMDANAITEIKGAVSKLLKPENPPPQRTARADSPLDAQLIWGWGDMSDDPDAKTLATWVLRGAPLGFDESIPCHGVFPRITATPADAEDLAELHSSMDDWSNWPSATEEQEDLCNLVRQAESKGFCEVIASLDEAKANLGIEPALNKLGVVVKYHGEPPKKNNMGSQGERHQ